MSRCSSNHVLGAVLGAACALCGCSPELVVGKVVSQRETCDVPDSEGGAPGIEDKTVEVGWSSGFENGFCDYEPPRGFCLGGDSYEAVSEPVHSGKSAAAYSVSSASDVDAGVTTRQSRCVVEGALPTDARYGAWFYIPELRVNSGNWNLVFFQGKNAGAPFFGALWDVSLRNADDGSLRLYIFAHTDILPDPNLPEPDPLAAPVPIGEWFHIEFRLLRAVDATGIVELRQDGALIQRASGIVTDQFEFHQWFVGNLVNANALEPPQSTLYVDDVSVTEP